MKTIMKINFLIHFRALLLSIVFIFGLSTGLRSQGFLKADGERIINGNGENVLLRGIGLGGWMLQEGYMLHLNK
ncbi:MAG TPA: hypothetical protein VFI33_14325, partial [Puia sp.]|nr:hypothetical protein [Puia sp.]